MRILLKIVLITFVFFGCGQKSEQDNDPEISRIMLGEFSVEGMMCERGCKSYITKQVNNLNGVEDCYIDYENKLMTVEFNLSSINADNIIDKYELNLFYRIGELLFLKRSKLNEIRNT